MDHPKAKNRQATIKRGSTVADKASKAPDPFDIKTVEALIALMVQHDLREIDLRSGDQRIRLSRGNVETPALPTPVLAVPTPAAAMTPPAAAPAHPKAEAAANAPPKKLIEIKSPTPGTVYAAASPDAQPFVRVGSKITPTTVVCLIEAMKIFNEIPADCTGVIAEILVENQQAVEYGQVLFRVDPTG